METHGTKWLIFLSPKMDTFEGKNIVSENVILTTDRNAYYEFTGNPDKSSMEKVD